MMDDTPALRCSYFSVHTAFPSIWRLFTGRQVPDCACGLCEEVLEPQREGDLPLAIGADGQLVSPDTCTSVRFEHSCKPTLPDEDLIHWQAQRLAQKRHALRDAVAASWKQARLVCRDAKRLQEQSEALMVKNLVLRLRSAVRRSSVAVL